MAHLAGGFQLSAHLAGGFDFVHEGVGFADAVLEGALFLLGDLDMADGEAQAEGLAGGFVPGIGRGENLVGEILVGADGDDDKLVAAVAHDEILVAAAVLQEIGRASCRERV